MSSAATRLARLALLAALAASASGCPKEPLPTYATVPDFALVDQHGRPFRAASLDGSPTVAAFVFTRCTTICPMLAAQLVNQRQRLGDRAGRVHFVAFSVDPAHDTPEVLRAYAARQGAGEGITFLTGDSAEIQRIARSGFLAAVGAPEVRGDTVDVIHSQHLMLLDGHRALRGFYRTDREGLEGLERDLDRLLEGR